MKEQRTVSPIRPLVRILTAAFAALVVGAGLFFAATPEPASATPCNYGKQIYCDGGDEPAWQWDGVDDFECVGIPGFAWNGDNADYSGVVGQVYYFKNGAYTLIHDSAAPAPAPKPKPVPVKPAPTAPKPSTGSTAAKPTATPTPTPTPSAEPTDDADDVDPATVSGRISVAGQLEPGGVIELEGSGFAPDAEFVIEVHSEVRTLATVSSDSSGEFSTEVTIPSDLEPGVHTVVVLVAAAIVVLALYSVRRSRKRTAAAASTSESLEATV